MLSLAKRRLIVNINDIRTFNGQLAKDLLQHPLELIPPFEKALQDIVIQLSNDQASLDFVKEPFHIGIEGAFGDLHISPRFLTSRMMSHLVCLDGIVTSCSLVRPKLIRSIHYCEKKQSHYSNDYRDAISSYDQLPTSNAYPTEDWDGNPLSSEFGLSIYRDHQMITLQEMPEKAPPGQLPRGIEVVLSDDLADTVKPGDRVQVVGVYRSISSVQNGQVPGVFRTILVCNNIRKLFRDNNSDEAKAVSSQELEVIRQFSKRKNVFDLIARSLAPSIHGHDYVKKAVLLMLLGGCEKNLDNGTHIRGDINVLLIGDPSTAKSQILRFVLNVAPLAISTTGRGASGVGLTAAVTHDKETGDRRLEAGAMVLADRGVVCVDEFDKMNDDDRVAIHEVMEQQTVTISKAGIHATLNARCSMIAAANPIFGQYKETASPQENIRLPDSLLSRFDLTFVILDRINPTNDRQISNHVLRMHRYIPDGVEVGAPIREDLMTERDGADEMQGNLENSSSIFAPKLNIFRSPHMEESGEEEEEEDECEEEQDILSIPFIKKYISVAKATFKPVLTKGASDVICEAYASFRQGLESVRGAPKTLKTFPVTARTLETLIRLSTAHAKCRFSNRIEKKDAQVAKELVEFCLYKEVVKKPRKKIVKVVQDDTQTEGDNEQPEESDSEPEENSKSTVTEPRVISQVHSNPESIIEKSLDPYSSTSFGATVQSQPGPSTGIVTPANRTAVRQALNRLRDSDGVSEMFDFSTLQSLLPGMSKEEIVPVLIEMENANQLMYRNEFIVLI